MSEVRVAHNLSAKPRTVDVHIDESVDFASLHLSDRVLQGLKSADFHRPSPIQLKAIPLGRCGLDLIVQAKSGTGKTCVFSVIALESVNVESNSVQAVVIAPTREIAVQIWEVINRLGSAIEGLRCYTFIGGMPLESDKKKLRRCHIAVGTPGRLKQLLEQGLMSPDSIRLFVLDEADKLLEQSFQETINWIYSCLPENKQMLALSATYPEALAQHLTAYMRAPTFVRLNAADPALLGIRQYYKKVPFHPLQQKVFESKVQETLKLLSAISFNQCLIFSNYQTRAESLSDQLTARGWPSTHISGQQEQQQRLTAMAKLRAYKCRVLVTTDLTSRGIDAENVNLVLHLDIPRDHETYLHRIGRAGRFGTYGASIALTSEGKELNQLCDIQDKCNTDIIALPAPIPSDLAKSSGYVSLDHLVSTQQLTPSNPLPMETDSTIEDKPHVEGRLTREGLDAPGVQGHAQGQVQGQAKVAEEMGAGDAATGQSAGKADESESKPGSNGKCEGIGNFGGANLDRDLDQEDQISKNTDDTTLYVPVKPPKLQFEYDAQPERKAICFNEITDLVNNASDVYQGSESVKIRSSSCPRNVQTLTDQLADVLDHVHLGQKQAMCRMDGEEEAKGLTSSETLGKAKNVPLGSVRTNTGDGMVVNDLKPKKKGRLVKEDLTLGQEYFMKLAPKDDFPDSDESETETDESDSTASASSTETETETTSYRESDFTHVKNRQKATGRRRTNSYRRMLSKMERNKPQSEGPLYADDEGSETPGGVTGAAYPKLEWTPVEKPAKQVDSKANEPNFLAYDDKYAETRYKNSAAGQNDEESREESNSSYSGGCSDSSGEEDSTNNGYPSPSVNPYAQYNNYPPFPPANFHVPNPRMPSQQDTTNRRYQTTSPPPVFPPFFPSVHPGLHQAPNPPPNFSRAADETERGATYEYEWYLYARYTEHQRQAVYYAQLYRQAVDARRMNDAYRRQRRYIKRMAEKCTAATARTGDSGHQWYRV